MNNKIVVLAVVIAISIFLGVTITVQQTNGPLMRRLVTQQSEIVDLQRQILNAVPQGGAPAGVPLDLTMKIAKIEKQVDEISQFFKRVQAPQDQQAGQRPPQRPTEDFSTVFEIPIDHSPVRGKKDAPVSITVFGDFQCPYSARFQPVLKDVLAAYPEQVNYVLKLFPLGFHPQAKPAAKAALAAAEQGKYWEMVDALLANSRTLSPEKIDELAEEVGLNMKKFKKNLEDNDAQYEKKIAADMALGQKVGVRGTPTFYINGRKTRARDMNGYKAEIEKILSEKK